MTATASISRPTGLSVVIPTYKRIQPTLRAIESVRSHYPDDVEIVVVDDGSPENPLVHLPMRNTSGIAVRGFRLTHNSGPQAARNLGIRRARFSHVTFLDSDEEFVTGKIDTMLALIRDQDIDLVFHAVSGMPRYHTLAALWDDKLRRLIPFRWLCVLYNPVCTSSLVIRRQNRLGPTRLRYCEDWAFLLRYVTPDTRVVYVHQELAFIHRPAGSPGGASAAIWEMRKGEFKARSMLLRNPFGPTDVARWCLGTSVGVLRVVADLLRGRYRQRIAVE